MFGPDGCKRVTDIVTGDESWFTFKEIARKQKNMVWLAPDEDRPQICKRGFSTAKRMYTVFFNYKGPLLVIVLPKGHTVTGNYYATTILPQLTAAIEKQRPKVGTSRTFILHDNASSHKTDQVVQTLSSDSITVLPHPPYSPDLAPLDFWLFPYLKEKLADRKFKRVQDLSCVIWSILREIPEELY